MPITVSTVITNVKRVLQEVAEDGVRWSNNELLAWLNEAYQAIVQIKPDASSVNARMQLLAGTRQSIPESGLRLIDVVRNTAENSEKMGVLVTTRRALDTVRRSWHADPQSIDIEQFIFDDEDPVHFYVYPPASPEAELEIIYAAVPPAHADEYDDAKSDQIRINDSFAPVITDYILMRAFSKDAEHAINIQRAQLHQNAYLRALGQKVQTDRMISPSPATREGVSG